MVRTLLLAALVSALILVLALSAALAQHSVAVMPTPLDDAEGELLERAGADLAEVLAQVQRQNPYWQLYYEDIMIYDYGTKKEGEFEVATTFYTFRQEIPTTRAKLGETTGGTVGGICVYTYAQAGTVCFKVYLKAMFSYNGSAAVAMLGECDSWTDGGEGVLSIVKSGDKYNLADTICAYYWDYDIRYGAAAAAENTGRINCTNDGIVTYGKTIVPSIFIR